LISVGVSKLRRWDLKTGKQLAEHPLPALAPHASRVKAAFSVDGTRVAMASIGDSGIRLHDTVSGEEIRRLAGHAQGTYALAFAPDGKALVSSGSDRTIRLWDVTSGKEVRKFGEIPAEEFKHAYALAISPDGKRLATARSGKDPVVVWDISTGTKLY